ncbi:MAG: hypothetical protein U1E81_13225 [Xanthobacteraceae bacterium]
MNELLSLLPARLAPGRRDVGVLPVNHDGKSHDQLIFLKEGSGYIHIMNHNADPSLPDRDCAAAFRQASDSDMSGRASTSAALFFSARSCFSLRSSLRLG